MDLTFWPALAAIIGVDLLLSGDNAIVIALVCRPLEPAQRRIGMALGTVAAILLRVGLAFVAAWALSLPGIGLAGGIFLLWVAVKLTVADTGEPDAKSRGSLWAAVATIALADIGMSTDNVAAIAALSHGDPWLLWLGIGISLPLVVAGSAAVSWVIDRVPLLIWAGAVLLGWIAGTTIAADSLIVGHGYLPAVPYLAEAACALFVAIVALSLRHIRRSPFAA